MPELFTFTAPVAPPKTVFRPSYAALDLLNSRIDLHVREWDGTVYGELMIPVTWTGAEAMTMMRAINKANLTTRTLLERLMDKALADGKLKAGNVGGVAD
jgi:hypothetical protein